MKTIKLYISVVILAILFPISAIAQSSLITAQKSYLAFDYVQSINYFEQIEEKTYDINKKLSDSYFKIGDFENAEKYAKDAAESKEASAEDYFFYASVLEINQKYDEAKKWYEKFGKLKPDDSRYILFAEKQDIYQKLMKDNSQFSIVELSFNTEYQDFAPSFYKDKIVFSSTNSNSYLINRTWNWNKQPFLNLFSANYTDTLEIEDIKAFKKNINKNLHEGTSSFNAEGTFMAFTRNNYKQKSSDNTIKLQLFTAELVNNQWKNLKEFTYNNKEYSVGQPALSPDGKTMYFASDMPGGYGGVDIYVSHLTDSTWTKPVNLGNKINTEGNEMFPFYHDAGFLFFASDGQPGLGGLDIFYAVLDENNQPLKLKNLAVPVNSSYDDFSFILSEDQTFGYFASNRPQGKGDDDIYAFRLLKPLKITVNGNTSDETAQNLPYTKVYLYNSDNQIVDSDFTDENGDYDFVIVESDKYKVTANKTGYSEDSKTFDATGTEDNFNANLVLQRKETILEGIATNTKGDELKNVMVYLFNDKNEIIDSLKTDNTGYYNFIIKDRMIYTLAGAKKGYSKPVNTVDATKEVKTLKSDLVLDFQQELKTIFLFADADTEELIPNTIFTSSSDTLNADETGRYIFDLDNKSPGDKIQYSGIAKKEGYIPVSYTFEQTLNDEVFEYENKIYLTKYKVGDDLGKLIGVNPIYFDLGKYEIRPDAAEELDKIVKFMNENPAIEIELGSHTDSRGSSESNMTLSDNRAKSSADYIKTRITNPERIYGKGYGETQILNGCVDGVKCTEEQHQENRRTEFKIVKVK